MHEIEAGQAVANPRRTRLGPDWTGRAGGVAGHPQPTPDPAREVTGDGRSSAELG
ncbi:hypothetical protein AB0I60_08205 [Actinosynnema sp. NPDC050436]|uniref:hypothetical protein n=1 Tax=Actinosynnema sp. NPDC050436 TaxID=3155659 RepID=UPI0033DB322A